MNKDTAKGSWKEIKGSVKEKWGKLTDDHLTEIDGKRDQLVGHVQKHYGLTKDEAETQVSDFERDSKHTF